MPRNNPTASVIEELEKRFLFVENEILRKNLAINLQYIIFLIQQDEENDLPGAISYSIYKNLILYTTSIIEGLLIDTFKTLLDKGKISTNSMRSVKNYKDIKKIHKLDDSTTIVWCKQVKGHEKFTRRTSFHDIIEASKRVKIMNEDILAKIDELREKRNKIHLAGLGSVDNYYSKDEVDEVFNLAHRFITEIENILKKK